MAHRTVYWSEYQLWLKCPTWHEYQYNDHLPKEEPTQQVLLGRRIGQALANRLRDPQWRPTLAFNRNLGSLEGLTGLLKEYDARYSSDRLLGPWKAEAAYTRTLDIIESGEELGCVVDGHAGDLVRETKVTDTPNLYLYRAQLLWNCFCAGVQQGELDIILRPGYHRPDWAFERIHFDFTEKDKLGLILDVDKFLAARQRGEKWKNPNSCGYCPHVQRCWA
jgi:hypothetical protein